MMYSNLPLHNEFHIDVVWDGESGGVATAGNRSVKLDTPIQFGGLGRHLCPDELFLSSIGGCLLTTFLYLKDKSKLKIAECRVEVMGCVDMIGRDGYRIAGLKAIVKAKIGEGGNEVKLKRLLQLTEEYCHITRSIEKSIPIEVEVEVMSAKKAT